MSVPSSSATTFILKSAYPSRYSVRPSSCLQIPHHRYPMTCALPPRIKQVGILGDVSKTPLSTRYLKNSRQPVDDWERRVWRVYINRFLALLFSPSFLQHNSLLFCPKSGNNQSMDFVPVGWSSKSPNSLTMGNKNWWVRQRCSSFCLRGYRNVSFYRPWSGLCPSSRS
jgi:hypothetical protein